MTDTDGVASPVTAPPIGSAGAETGLEARVVALGQALADSMGGVLAMVPGAPRGPQALAGALGLDKVLASRVLKAMRAGDPMAVVHHLPGPEPLRRLLLAARRTGVPMDRVDPALAAVDRFEALIRSGAGDRAGLDAVISAWLPEARREFELRRKQSAFRAMSQLKGVEARVNLATALLHPGASTDRIDVVWIMGHLGLQRLRPGATARFATRRLDQDEEARRPMTLSGLPIESIEDAMLPEFCVDPVPRMVVDRAGASVHYALAGDAFGPESSVDFLLAEVNLDEIPRFVPRGSGRRSYVFASVSIPVRTLVFDALVHRDLYGGRDPSLVLYDTAIDGIASVNDRSRDISRLDMIETLQSMGTGIAGLRTGVVPRYIDMLRAVFARTGWDEQAFRGYRCAIEYPVYGSQVVMAFDASERSDD